MKHSKNIQRIKLAFAALLCAFVSIFLVACLHSGAGSADSSSGGSASSASSSVSSASSTGAPSAGASSSSGTSSASSTSSDGSVSSASSNSATSGSSGSASSGVTVTQNGTYTSKDEVALYIHTYGKLPSNFISKTKARRAGWDPDEGNLQEVCPGMSIGGSVFYNDDGLLPDKKGRVWHECDINYHGGYRGAERLVYSNDGLIYYTADHYESFERLY